MPPATLERLAARPEITKCAPGPECVLNVTILYEDQTARDWAAEVCERVAGLVGNEIVRSRWWKLEDLSEPAVLAGAVSTALRADVIIVAVRAADGLPLPFYVWVDSWLPYVPRAKGALVALITMPCNPSPRLDRVRDYLSAVARQGRLDFMIEERTQSPTAVAPRRAEIFSSPGI